MPVTLLPVIVLPVTVPMIVPMIISQLAMISIQLIELPFRAVPVLPLADVGCGRFRHCNQIPGGAPKFKFRTFLGVKLISASEQEIAHPEDDQKPGSPFCKEAESWKLPQRFSFC